MARKSVEKTQAITPAERKKYREHFEIHFDELKWLYTELYKDEAMFAELCNILEMNYVERPKELKKRDRIKELNPRWYKSQDQVGMMAPVFFGGDPFSRAGKELRIKFRGHVMHRDRYRFRGHFPDFRSRIKGQMQQVKIIFAHCPIKKETVDPEKQLLCP